MTLRAGRRPALSAKFCILTYPYVIFAYLIVDHNISQFPVRQGSPRESQRPLCDGPGIVVHWLSQWDREQAHEILGSWPSG